MLLKRNTICSKHRYYPQGFNRQWYLLFIVLTTAYMIFYDRHASHENNSLVLFLKYVEDRFYEWHIR